MGSQTNLPAMVRAHSESGCIKRIIHIMLNCRHKMLWLRHRGTRAPQSCHIWNSTPCPPPPARLLYSPPRNYFPKNHERVYRCPNKKPGLYANIHAKKKRIAAGSGEKMRKVGSKGAPTADAFKQAAKTRMKKGK